jgi:pyruvate-formate lyase
VARGTFTVTTHLEFGSMTLATPTVGRTAPRWRKPSPPGRVSTKNGPTAYMLSAAKLPHYKLGNGDM